MNICVLSDANSSRSIKKNAFINLNWLNKIWKYFWYVRQMKKKKTTIIIVLEYSNHWQSNEGKTMKTTLNNHILNVHVLYMTKGKKICACKTQGVKTHTHTKP